MIQCPSCGSEHLGVAPCGLTFRERLASTQLSGSVTETRTKRNYYDNDAVTSMFGEDSAERMAEETAGVGAIHRGPDGRDYMRDRHTKDIREATPGDLKTLSRGFIQ